ncbi:MAG: hypothetical protein O2971_04405 [Proteobacteria bacterium]|nr:hypothetical protein [Pseudomonadota bacterium]
MSEPKYALTINVRHYCLLLLVVALLLIAIHTGLYLYNYQVEELPWLLLQLFDLDEENNIPTWFSSFLLLNNAFVLYLITTAKATERRYYWGMMAAGFFILAVDEVAGLHESFNTAIDSNWAIFGGILVLLVVLAFIPFLLSLPRRLALLFILSGAGFVSGAIIVELLSEDMDSDSLAYMMAVMVEEGLEMLGALLFLFVNLRTMASQQLVPVHISVSYSRSD